MIDILLSVYNGARYLPELLASISGQTSADWQLIVRDDGSTDNSMALVAEFSRLHQGKCMVVPSPEGNIGIMRSFSALLAHSTAPFFMFCDQDDFWLPDKLQTFCDFIDQHGLAGDQAGVFLIHSDLDVVDAERRPLFLSHVPRAMINQARLSTLIRENVVTGCVALGNARLREIAVPIPPEAKLHDWWVAIVAAALGKVYFIDRKTVQYRQHQGNQVGAFTSARRARLQEWRKPHRKLAGLIRETTRRQTQAKALLARVVAHIDGSAKKTIADFVATPPLIELPVNFFIRRGWAGRRRS